MSYVKEVDCPVKFYCKKLKREIEVSKNAIFSIEFGWICDCGDWVKDKKNSDHDIILFGKREGFVKD